jgi:hypothetical protein
VSIQLRIEQRSESEAWKVVNSLAEKLLTPVPGGFGVFTLAIKLAASQGLLISDFVVWQRMRNHVSRGMSARSPVETYAADNYPVSKAVSVAKKRRNGWWDKQTGRVADGRWPQLCTDQSEHPCEQGC